MIAVAVPPHFARAVARVAAFALIAGFFVEAGCQRSTELELDIGAPTVDLLNPLSLPVSDFVLKNELDAILAAVSIGASRDSSNRLPLGALDPALNGDLTLDVMSGSQLVGLARIDNAEITPGQVLTLEADIRKPLVVVGAADAAELAGSRHAPELLDPTTSTDLVERGIKVPASQASGFTTDGKTLFLAAADGLRAFDTGTGTASAPTPTPFVTAKMAIAPKNLGLALVESASTNSRVIIYTDPSALVASPTTAPSVSATIATGRPRTAHFSNTGDVLFVLVEPDGAEPCTGKSVPAANEIIPITRDGKLLAPIRLPSFVADFGVDRGGRLILSESGGNRISAMALDASFASVGTPVKLYDAACPTAIRLLEDQLFVVTNDLSNVVSNAFSLMRGHVDGAVATRLAIARPTYQSQLNDSSTPDQLTSLNVQLVSTAVAASELVVSPDGNRAVFASRSRYLENKQAFTWANLACTATADIIEYGLHSVDLTAGTTSYETRSQNVVVPPPKVPAATTDPCVLCKATFDTTFPPTTLTIPMLCVSVAGDRAAGLAASFAEQR